MAILRPDTPYLVLGLLGFFQGAGTGAVMMPTMSSSSRDLNGPDLASGSVLLSLISTIANVMGTVAVSVLFAVLTVAMTGGASLAALADMGMADKTAQVVTIVDALRLTQMAALLMMSLALVVRLRSPRASVILDRPDLSAKAGRVS